MMQPALSLSSFTSSTVTPLHTRHDHDPQVGTEAARVQRRHSAPAILTTEQHEQLQANLDTLQRTESTLQWWAWTATVFTARGIQGAVSNLFGYIVEECFSRAAEKIDDVEDIDDHLLIAHAVLNMLIGALEGARVALHTGRALAHPDAYWQGLRGQSHDSPLTLSAAGTPRMPASRFKQCLLSAIAGLGTWTVSAHTGALALMHAGGNSPEKLNAYRMVTRSNGRALHMFTRELAHEICNGLGFVDHPMHLTPTTMGFSAVPPLAQQIAQQVLDPPSNTPRFERLKPALTAAFAALDTATMAAIGRFNSPDQPVQLCQRHLSEQHAADTRRVPHVYPNARDTLERVTQRGTGRHLFYIITQEIPQEMASFLRPYLGTATDTICTSLSALLQSFTHLRDLLSQAEKAATDQQARETAAYNADNQPRV